jgi:hypothetical protein
MGFKPRERDYVSKLVVEKQRAVYWICALLEQYSDATREGARRALQELGYDQPRIETLLLLGEPTMQRARQRRRIAAQLRLTA